MYKRIICFNFFILLISCTTQYVDRNHLIPFKNKNGKWGYADSTCNKVIIPCTYDLTYPFINGIARVVLMERDDTVKEKYGLIDTLGKLIVPCIYEDIAPFDRGTTIVKKEGKYELIDYVGNTLTHRSYDEIKKFNKIFPVAVVSLNEKYGCINLLGKEIIPCKYSGVTNFERDSMVIVTQMEGYKKREAFYKYDGTAITTFKYEDTSPFFGEYTIVRDTTGRYGFIDTSGKEKMLPEGYDIMLLSDGMANLYKKNKFGYISDQGEIAFLKNYRPVEARQYASGLVGYTDGEKGEKWGFYDKKGKLVIPFIYDNITDFEGDFCVVVKGRECGLINKKNEVIIPFEFDNIDYISDSLIFVKKGDKWGITDISGKLILPFQFYSYSVINKNLIQLAVKNEKDQYYYGFYNWEGKLIQPHKYYNKIEGEKYWQVFYEGLAQVYKDNGFGFIDEKGNEVIPCIYECPDNIKYPEDIRFKQFRWGVVYVKSGEKYGYIDERGNEYWIKGDGK